MKIINKTYVLVLILIIAAGINLTLLYQAENVNNSQSYTIIKIGDLKVEAEAVAGLAVSAANGSIEDKKELQNQIEKIDVMITALKNGGNFKDQTIQKIPATITAECEKMLASWNEFKEKALNVEKKSVFDRESINAMNYVLQKNSDLVLTTNALTDELSTLDRDYNQHKEIAKELEKSAKEIGQITLLISIGDEGNIQERLENEKIKFQTGIQKLLGVSTVDKGQNDEKLIQIPRENSKELKKLDALWESLQPKILILEERALLSPDFNIAKNEMNVKKAILFSDVDVVINAWNEELTKQDKQEQLVVQIVLLAEIGIFLFVIYVIRESLSPLRLITNALSGIKEGEYGQKIKYNKADEIGSLVNTFNIMSDTIKEKEEQSKTNEIAKDEFLAMVTHELKTPLVPIQGYADILLSEHLGKLTEKQRERINIIKTSSETLLSLISDLLDAQKLELGQLRMKKETQNIKDTITSAVESFIPQAQKSNIEITLNVFDVTIDHDKERIKQVIANLIKNSLTAVEPRKGKIEVSMNELPKEIQINVKDNGVGIPTSKQENLFKKFYQVDTSLTREKSGSGLGLAICKGIVENHNGTISVTSTPNHETVFTVTLPKNTKSGKTPL
ncbi:MAG: sensor histidine kinase [Nitrosarchaeum sp.]